MRLHQHGEHVRPAYAPPPGETEGMGGKSNAEERPEGHGGINRRFSKDEVAGWDPKALGWIKATYRDAIEYAGLTEELEGFALWGGAIGLALLLVCIWASLFILTFHVPFWLRGIGATAFAFLGMLSAYGIVWSLRLTIYKPFDLPILFDRKHRRVYRILQEQPADRWAIFKPWPIKACAYEWDLIDAEHEIETFTTGATINRNHYLMFVVRKSADDATIIDNFQVGNAMLMNEELVANMYEHIRRFMEEGGPHLPSDDEPLAVKRKDQPTWWEACGTVGVFGSQYKKKWREQPFYALIAHLVFPVSIPANIVVGTGNWLFYKTAIHVEWPDEVKQAVGPLVRGGQ